MTYVSLPGVSFMDALTFVLMLATHWGVLVVPDGYGVLLVNFRFEENEVVEPGVVLVTEGAGVTCQSCTLHNCDLGVADTLIEIIREEIERAEVG